MAAVLVSLGHWALLYPPHGGLALASDLTIEGFADAHALSKVAGLAAVLGNVMFGLSILRSRIDPAWTGIALAGGSLLVAGVMLSGGTDATAAAANLWVSVALIAFGLRALRRSPYGP